MRYFIGGLLFIATALAKEDVSYDPDPKLNWRPQNVTDLAYYLYQYIGSYYNGTTTIRLTPQDWSTREGETICTRFQDANITLSFDSLVGVVKTNEYDKGDNPIMLLVKAWEPNFNLTPTAGNDQPHSDQTDDFNFHLESIRPKNKGYTIDKSTSPLWNLTTTYLSGSSYSVSGSSNTGSTVFQWNMSQCDSARETWWGANVLYKEDDRRDRYDLLDISDPVLSGRFDNQSATFSLRGFFRANTDPKVSGEPMSELGGQVIIEFLGQLDAARSDDLVAGSEEPKWIPTIGFSKQAVTAAGNKTSGGERQGTNGLYGYGFWALVVTILLNI